VYFGLSGLDFVCCWLPGATRFALAPGYHISRLWREAEPSSSQQSNLDEVIYEASRDVKNFLSRPQA